MPHRPIYALILLLVLYSTGARADDAGINAAYARMSDYYVTHDARILTRVYDDKIVYVPANPKFPPVIGRAPVIELSVDGVRKLKAQGRDTRLRFRVSHRQLLGDTAVDVGVLRFDMTGGAETRTTYSRFTMVSRRQPGGDWAFVVDTGGLADASAWDGAARLAGAKFDE